MQKDGTNFSLVTHHALYSGIGSKLVFLGSSFFFSFPWVPIYEFDVGKHWNNILDVPLFAIIGVKFRIIIWMIHIMKYAARSKICDMDHKFILAC